MTSQGVRGDVAARVSSAIEAERMQPGEDATKRQAALCEMYNAGLDRALEAALAAVVGVVAVQAEESG